MKIYTRTGDDGTTGLFGGQRVQKSDLRVECYGTVDEVNAALGLAVAEQPAASQEGGSSSAYPRATDDPQSKIQNPKSKISVQRTPFDELAIRVHRVQNDLFAIGSHLATPNPAKVNALAPMKGEMVDELEAEIDAAEAQMPPLRQFILPGGCETAGRLHLARTICRRAERLLVAFAATNPSPPPEPLILIYMNRLGDWIFVQARWINHQLNVADVPWVKRT